MKLEFIAASKGRDWEVGETRDFKDKDEVQMTYARKYIARGWAKEIKPAAPASHQATDHK